MQNQYFFSTKYLQQSSHLIAIIWAKFVLKGWNAQASLMVIYLSVIWHRIGISDHYFVGLFCNDAKLQRIVQSSALGWGSETLDSLFLCPLACYIILNKTLHFPVPLLLGILPCHCVFVQFLIYPTCCLVSLAVHPVFIVYILDTTAFRL